MTYLSSHCYMGEIEYCIEEEDWVSLASSFKNEQCYIPLFRLLTDFKKNDISVYDDTKKSW